jgi:hypothetical protein
LQARGVRREGQARASEVKHEGPSTNTRGQALEKHASCAILIYTYSDFQSYLSVVLDAPVVATSPAESGLLIVPRKAPVGDHGVMYTYYLPAE